MSLEVIPCCSPCASSLCPVFSIQSNQCVGRAIVGELWLLGAFQFGDDAVGKHFAQFDAPLVEGVDIPDGALREDLVFVEGDELAQRLRGQTLSKDGIGWAVALEGTVWHGRPGRRRLRLPPP